MDRRRQRRTRPNLCLEQTKFCHCLRLSTVTDAGSGQAAEGPSDNTTHYSAAKKTQTGRNTPKDHIVPFSFIKHWGGGKRKEKRTLEVLLDSFCSSAFPSSWELVFFKDTLIFLFFLPPPPQTVAWNCYLD